MLSCLFAVLLFAEVYAEPSVTVDTLGPVQVSKEFPTFGSYTLDGGYISFKSLLEQDKTIVISYFATWCHPCREGLPVIEKVVQGDPNVQAIYIAVGEKAMAPVEQMVKELNLQSPIVVDKFETIGQRHGVVTEGVQTELPRTFVIAPNGTVQTIFVKEGDDLETKLRQEVTKNAKK